MKIYIDAIKGSDLNGDGTFLKPYATLHYFCTIKSVKNGKNYDLELANGEYLIYANTFNGFQNSSMTIVGRQKNTKIKQQEGLSGGYKSFNLSFIRLQYIIPKSLYTSNLNMYNWNLNFQNVVLAETPDSGASVFLPYDNNQTSFKNCVKIGTSINYLRTTNGIIKVYDSIGGFTSGYGTNETNWNTSGNLIGTYDVDSEFRVIGHEDKGVFSGEFAWDLSSFKTLFYNEGKYKTYYPKIQPVIAENIIPKMTSNTTPKGVASSSAVYSIAYNAYTAMNGVNYPTDYYWLSATKDGWLSYEFEKDTEIQAYSFKGIDGVPNRTAKAWSFESYNYSTGAWEVLHTGSLSVADSIKHKLTLPKKTIGKKFRINVTQTFGDLLAIDEFEIISAEKEGSNAYWLDVSSTKPTPEQFLEFGIDNLQIMNIDSSGHSPFDELNGNIEVLSFTTSAKSDNRKPTLYLNANLNKDILIYPESDISLVGVETIDKLTLISIGDAKIAISFDEGLTWKAFKNGVWITVENAHNGMVYTELNALTSELIKNARGNSDYIRFSYYLVDGAEVDNIEMKVSLVGREKLASTSDFDILHDSLTNKIIFNIKKDGTYSVNYVDTI